MNFLDGILFALFAEADKSAPLMVPDSVQKANFAETVRKLANLDVDQLLQNLLSESVWILIKVLIALAIYFVGRWIVRRIIHLLDAVCERRRVDVSLRSFLRNTVRVVFTLLLVLIVVSTLGVNVTSLIAVFSAATLAIGMALSGTAQNFAGGVMILLMKPYRIGDYIEAQGQAGTVKEIRLFSTVVTTTDNKRIYIPNSSISNAIVNNYSSETMRRVEWKVSLAYGDDVAVAKRTMLAMLESDKRVLHTPDAPADPFVALSELADSAIVVVARTWTLNGDYWDLFFDMNERFYNELPQQGLHFPFPQLDVHLDK